METLYKNIIILEESDTKLIGDFEIDGLMEADSDGKQIEQYNESVFSGISDVIKLFNNDKDTVNKVTTQLSKNQKKLSSGKLKDLFLFFATKVVVLLSHGSRSIIKAINFLWSGTGAPDSKWKGFKSLPGLSKVTGFVSSMIDKTGIRQLKVFGTELRVADLVKFITVMFVLVGSIGFIVAKTKNGFGSLCVVSPIVTWRSCMASSRALCTFAGALLISSAKTKLANIGPFLDTNSSLL